MKIIQTSLALIALFALMLPCAHAGEHHEHGVEAIELCAADHTDCHACSDEPCAETPVVASVVSALEIPVRQVQIFTLLETARPTLVAVAHSSGDIHLLQTVQLLI